MAAAEKIDPGMLVVTLTQDQLRALIGDAVEVALDKAGKIAPKFELLTLKQLAEGMQLSTRTITTWVAENGMPSIRVGNEWRFDLKEVQAWLAEQKPDLDERVRAGRAKRLGK